MGNSQHIIELNGKRYDTVSGKQVAATPDSEAHAKKHHTQVRRGKTLDGFARPTHTVRQAPNSLPGQKVQKSKTLMRTTVRKPEPRPVRKAAVQQPRVMERIQASKQISHAKLVHAHAVAKSALIRRFNNDMVTSPHIPPQPSAHAAQPAQRVQAVATAIPASTSPLSSGLANATSHNEPRLKKPRLSARVARKLKISPRVMSGGALALAAIVVAGFFAYQNIPNIDMRLASARSGVHGSLPGYQPAGFGVVGGVSYKPGQIVVTYKSRTDDRNFHIIQNDTPWNTQSLLDNFVAVNHPNNQVVQDRGKTIYLYVGSNATWVDAGIWYRIEGNSQLNSNQLLDIAASL